MQKVAKPDLANYLDDTLLGSQSGEEHPLERHEFDLHLKYKLYFIIRKIIEVQIKYVIPMPRSLGLT